MYGYGAHGTNLAIQGSLVLPYRLHNYLRSVKAGNYGVSSRWGPHCKTSYGDSATEDEERCYDPVRKNRDTKNDWPGSVVDSPHSRLKRDKKVSRDVSHLASRKRREASKPRISCVYRFHTKATGDFVFNLSYHLTDW